MIISFIRTILLYMVIVLAVRIMGKRQISELQTSELVVTLLISDIASIPMQNPSIPIVTGIIPIIVLIACEILISTFMLKSSKFRTFICGNPITLINDGKLDQKKMQALRMSIDDLMKELRQLEVSSISDVAYAIVETNGKLSIIKKPEKQEVDASMLKLEIQDSGIETVVIKDGEISEPCLQLCKLDKNWLFETLKIEKVNVKDVFIMTANKNKEYKIIKKEV